MMDTRVMPPAGVRSGVSFTCPRRYQRPLRGSAGPGESHPTRDTESMEDALRPGGEEPRRRTFRSNVLLNYGTNLTVAVLALVNILIVSRALGPTGRGDVAFLSAVLYLTANLAALGIQEANANIGASEPERRAALATNSLAFSLLFSVLSGAIVIGLVVAFPVVGGDVDRTLLWVTVATVPVLILQLYFQYLIQSDYRFVVTNVAWLLSPI